MVNVFGCLLLKIFKNFLILISIYCMKIVQYENISLLHFFFNFSADYYDILVLIIRFYYFLWLTMVFYFCFFYFGIVLQFFSSIIQIYLLSSIFFWFYKERKKREKVCEGTYKQTCWHLFNLWKYPSSWFRFCLFVFDFFTSFHISYDEQNIFRFCTCFVFFLTMFLFCWSLTN